MLCLYFNSFSFFDDEQERALQVCTYSGSSSDTETELEDTGSTLGSPQRTLIHRAKKRDSGAFESCHFSLLLVLFFPPFISFHNKNPPSCSGPERGDPEEEQRGEILVNHGLLPTRCVYTSGEGQQEDLPVQLVAQRVIPRQHGRRKTKCEY